MPFFEITITGAPPVFYDYDGEYCLEEEDYIFVWQADDLIEAIMTVQSKIDSLNEALREKYPKQLTDAKDWEYKIVAIGKNDRLIAFSDDWVKEYIESLPTHNDYMGK